MKRLIRFESLNREGWSATDFDDLIKRLFCRSRGRLLYGRGSRLRRRLAGGYIEFRQFGCRLLRLLGLLRRNGYVGHCVDRIGDRHTVD
jgi:hypothetical protein